MIYVVNDLHGAKKLITKTTDAMSWLKPGDILIVNGDGAGARGPIMNQIVKIFYEVRRGETDQSVLMEEISKVIGEWPEIPPEWIYVSVHAGVFRKLMANKYPKFEACMRKEATDVLEETLCPLSEAAAKYGVQIVYVPGNGEIVPDDFVVDDITTEQTVAPEERFYQKLAKTDYFEKFGVLYVPYVRVLPADKVLLLSTHLLDLPEEAVDEILFEAGVYGKQFNKVLVHYPPAISPIGGAFDFWTPNKSDLQRTEMLGKILAKLQLAEDAAVYFGHIHLGANDARMDRYPDSMTFMDKMRSNVWVKPGTVVKI